MDYSAEWLSGDNHVQGAASLRDMSWYYAETNFDARNPMSILGLSNERYDLFLRRLYAYQTNSGSFQSFDRFLFQ